MRRYRGLDLSKHQELGDRLYRIREDLFDMSDDIHSGYAKAHRVPRRFRKLLDALDSLRSSLDDAVCGEFRDQPNDVVLRCYYGKGSKQ
jgi:hypothetical protein